ncbi:MAG: AAA family ATPase [Patescibacteria group bacterium]|nr:AAA family ATPase [Patescibacteria group bacterium]MDE2438058.1 AAA family ATPase [Patescibacteria group bacterium]
MLKSIELIGFKSFANKTILEFPARVTAIVGPNGSGKSNIVDAFRWILGERGATNLRSENQESLIFSGSHKKSAMSFAEARFHFDNSNALFPLEFSEFSIGRRVERDGSSRFFLNQEEMRLRDLAQLFARAKIGTKGVSIINQGEADHFIRVTPEKRRELIEEAVGLKEYQLKQRETLAKLAAAEQNLAQTTQLLAEITPHLRSLRRSAERYAKRDELEQACSDAACRYFASFYGEIETEIQKVSADREFLSGHIMEQQAILATHEQALQVNTVDTDRSSLVALMETRRMREDARQTLLSELNAAERMLTRKLQERNVGGEPAYQALRDMVHDVEEACEALLSVHDVASIHVTLGNLLTRVKDLFRGSHHEDESSAEYEEKKQALLHDLHALEDEIAMLLVQEKEEEQRYGERTRSFSTLLHNVDQARKDLFSLRTQEDALHFEEERLNLRVEHIKEKLKEYDISFDSLLSRRRMFPPLTVSERNALEERMMRLKRELALIGSADESLLSELASTEERHAFLSSQSSDLVRATEDLRTLGAELDLKIKTDFQDATIKLNTEFTHAFGLLSDGGKARLVMQKEPHTVSEGEELMAPPGVDIALELPRKKITSLDMLSGGERTLVALAFMCALVAVAEPPFLVLDEVDAALDEQNAVKFGTLMRTLAKNTQFVIITHNRATMEAADVLYGVTMADDGISRLLSLKLS